MTVTMKKKAVPRSVARSSDRSQRPVELPDGMWERISRKAYELWEARGCREGNDLEDWLDAETIVMEEIHEARE
ncbi:MAG TPA: DUF2934 domain-containing protein [Nitrospiraceae bacterium]